MELYLHHPAICVLPAEVKATDVADLTRRMAAGDEDAYRTFYDAYYDRLSRYLLVVARGDEDAAVEALQSALVRIARHIKIFKDETVFWSWLTVVARTALSDQTRTRRRYLALLDRFRWQSDEEQTQAETNSASPGLDENTRLLKLLESQLAGLPFEDRQVVEWKYLDGRSVREIADALQVSEKAVESRLSRARRRLKEGLLIALHHE